MRALACCCACLALAGPGTAQGGVAQLVSVSSTGAQGNNGSGEVEISADGRFVAFISFAANLWPGDTNGVADVFVHDRQTRQTTCISVDPSGKPGNGESVLGLTHVLAGHIAADGRFVVFTSAASNLVANDTNYNYDVFVRDLLTGQTTRVSEPTGGGNANNGSTDGTISGDGRYVAFVSWATNLVANDKNGKTDIFLHDRLTKTIIRISEAPGGLDANDNSWSPHISLDGGWIAYTSRARNLVSNDNNQKADVFLYDRVRAVTTRVSVGTGMTESNADSEGPCVDIGGISVAFESYATNLVGGDTNGKRDVFVYQRLTGTTRRVSVRSDGKELDDHSAYPAMLGGRIVFYTWATNATDLAGPPYPRTLLHDLASGKTIPVDMTPWGQVSAGGPGNVSLSGREIAIPGPDDMVLHDHNGCVDAFVRILYPAISALDRPAIGAGVRLHLEDPQAAGLGYLALTALDYKPAIPIDWRWLYVTPDPVLFLSASFPAIFQNYSGTLDASGQATATFHVPNDKSLAGLSTWTAFVTFEPSAPSGVAGISNTVRLRLR